MAMFWILLAPVSALLFLVGLLIHQIIDYQKPFLLLKTHVFFTKLGFYSVDRNEGYFEIKTPFSISVRFREESRYKAFEKVIDPNRIEVKGEFSISPFQFTYVVNENKIEDFTCSENFAKDVKGKNFQKMMEKYLPIILEKESGKKTNRQLAIEAINNKTLGTGIQKVVLSNEEELHILSSDETDYSRNMRLSINAINQKANMLKDIIKNLDIEEQHQFLSLMNKRLPKLLHQYQKLDFMKQKGEQKQIEELLHQASQKLDIWLKVSQEEMENEYVKEKLLFENMVNKEL